MYELVMVKLQGNIPNKFAANIKTKKKKITGKYIFVLIFILSELNFFTKENTVSAAKFEIRVGKLLLLYIAKYACLYQ
jgi:hypothetical protein